MEDFMTRCCLAVLPPLSPLSSLTGLRPGTQEQNMQPLHFTVLKPNASQTLRKM